MREVSFSGTAVILVCCDLFSPETEEFEATDQKLLGICLGQEGASYEHLKVRSTLREKNLTVFASIHLFCCILSLT